MSIKNTGLGIALLLAMLSSARAQVPRMIPFQATVKTAAGASVSGDVSVTLSLYATATGGTALWSETKTVKASNGLISTALGDTAAIPDTVKFDAAYFVGVKVGTDAEMTPRLPLMSVPYALALPGVTVDSGGGVSTHYRGLGAPNFNLVNDVGMWHISGPRSGGSEGGNNLTVFWNDGTYHPVMTVYDNGNVGIGTTSPGVRLDVNGSIRSAGNLDVAGGITERGPDFQLIGRGGGDGNNGHAGRALVDAGPGGGLEINYANDFGAVRISGPVYMGTLTLTSSRRYKRNVQPIENALDTVSKLQGVSYDWDAAHGGKRDIGFIAEDLGQVAPELVTWEANGKDAKGIDYSHLTALLAEGIKDLKARNDTLEAENGRKDQRIDALEARLERLERLVAVQPTGRSPR